VGTHNQLDQIRKKKQASGILWSDLVNVWIRAFTSAQLREGPKARSAQEGHDTANLVNQRQWVKRDVPGMRKAPGTDVHPPVILDSASR